MTGGEIVRSPHWEILQRLRGLRNPYEPAGGSPEEPQTHPTPGSFRAAADSWKLAGAEAASLADGLRKAKRRLMSDDTDSGWRGPAADRFSARVDEITRFAEEIAHLCDSEHEKPKPPPQEGRETPLRRSAEIRGSGGFRQRLLALADFVEGIRDDGSLPPPPWSVPWAAYRIDYSGESYAIRDGDRVLVSPRIGEELIPYQTMWSCYQQAGTAVAPRTDGGLLPATPADADLLLRWMRFNQVEEDTCRETATRLAEVYAESAETWPEPAEAPRPAPDDRDRPAGGGAGGAGSGGIGRGAAGLRDVPDLGAVTSRAPAGPAASGTLPAGPSGPGGGEAAPGAMGSAGQGTGRGIVPMGMGGGGAGAGVDGTEQGGTWLEEDREDPWGVSDDATSWLVGE